MIPITQTICTETDGNCLAASIASILENNLKDYPSLSDGPSWYQQITDYLETIGFVLLCIEGVSPFCLKGYYLVIGETATGGKHCVVGYNGKIVHDPSPHRSINSSLKIIYYGFLSKIIE